jgi:membrane-associated phospholipid phosphatase
MRRVGRVALVILLAIVAGSQQALAQSPAAVDPPPPTVMSVFAELGRTFRHLVSRDSAVTLGVAGLASLGVKSEDAAITRRASQSQPLEAALDQGAFIGNGATQVSAAVAVYTLGRALHRPAAASLGADLLQGQIVNGLLTQSVKYATHRTRPDGGRYSFPSGHSSASFATAAVLQRRFGWRVGGLAYAAAGYVAASRLSERQHFASDVIFGAGLGIVSGRAVTVVKRKAEWTLTPAPVRGGGSLWVTLRVI